jgi:catechol 2,3-dioxygenase-like lactoylglutathione lyase family enzyme
VPSLHHVDLVVTSLPRSLAFYLGVLGPLGWTSEGGITGERGEEVRYLHHPDRRGSLGLRERRSDAHPVPYDRYAVGVHHVCVGADSRAQVDAVHAWLADHAAGHGAQIESAPREYGYTPGYYAVFFHDADGLKLEVLHQPEG